MGELIDLAKYRKKKQVKKKIPVFPIIDIYGNKVDVPMEGKGSFRERYKDIIEKAKREIKW